jgi:mRNA interferase RelE/StbE
MNYSVSIKQSALKSLKNIDHEDRLRIVEAINQLKINPVAGGALKGEYSGFCRIRIGHRHEVYR